MEVQPKTSSIMQILILGDGNFSFTLAVSELLFHQSVAGNAAARYLGLPLDFDMSQIQIVATSFDSEEELYEKYPETESILQRIRAKYSANVILEHRINAWDIASHYHDRFPQGFDTIIWNHPHLVCYIAKIFLLFMLLGLRRLSTA